MMPILIAELPENLQQDALKAFADLANQQRGRPEMAGGGGPLGSNPHKLHEIGVWLFLTEHVGDLTHRMSQRNCEKFHFGITMIDEKCRKCIGMLDSRYGCEREIEEQVRANYQYAVKYKNHTGMFEQWRSEWIRSGEIYADEHRKLRVYNKAQYFAREAAIAVGMREYSRASQFLHALHSAVNGDWEKMAGVVEFDSDGRLLTYEEWSLNQ